MDTTYIPSPAYTPSPSPSPTHPHVSEGNIYYSNKHYNECNSLK